MNKAEQDFEEWYYNWWSHNAETENYPIPKYREFITLPIEFRWGVYQKFFRPEDIDVWYNGEEECYIVQQWAHDEAVGAKILFWEETFKTPEEAIDKANELYQEQLK